MFRLSDWVLSSSLTYVPFGHLYAGDGVYYPSSILWDCCVFRMDNLRSLLRVRWGLLAVATPCVLKAMLRASLTPWMYRMLTRAVGLSTIIFIILLLRWSVRVSLLLRFLYYFKGVVCVSLPDLWLHLLSSCLHGSPFQVIHVQICYCRLSQAFSKLLPDTLPPCGGNRYW